MSVETAGMQPMWNQTPFKRPSNRLIPLTAASRGSNYVQSEEPQNQLFIPNLASGVFYLHKTCTKFYCLHLLVAKDAALKKLLNVLIALRNPESVCASSEYSLGGLIFKSRD